MSHWLNILRIAILIGLSNLILADPLQASEWDGNVHCEFAEWRATMAGGLTKQIPAENAQRYFTSFKLSPMHDGRFLGVEGNRVDLEGGLWLKFYSIYLTPAHSVFSQTNLSVSVSLHKIDQQGHDALLYDGTASAKEFFSMSEINVFGFLEDRTVRDLLSNAKISPFVDDSDKRQSLAYVLSHPKIDWFSPEVLAAISQGVRQALFPEATLVLMEYDCQPGN